MSAGTGAAGTAALRREHDVVLAGIRLHYVEWPSARGDAVVFLHGGGLSARSWDSVGPALADGYHGYAIDLRGHGDSEWSPTLEYDLADHLDDLEAFVEHLGIGRFFLVGHSLGAFIAIRYAAAHADRLAGLVVVDASPFLTDNAGVDRVRRFVLGRQWFDSLDDAVDYALRFEPRRDRQAVRRSVEAAMRPQRDGRWTWKHDRRPIDAGYFASRIAEAHSLIEHLRAIQTPTLVVRGENSDGTPAEDALRFTDLLPAARLITVDGAGHNVHRDNPAVFIDALRRFLDEHQTVPAGLDDKLGSGEELRSVYRPPAQRSLDKEIDHLDDHCRDFIAHSPFLVLASSNGEGRVDASPKGGPPGFVTVLDDGHLAIPDMAGNNRLDSMRNIVEEDGVASLFLVPGTDETLRVNGRAVITTDATVLDRCLVAGRRPNVAIVVEVRSAFIHCAKALRRAALWDPAQWPDTTDMASPACMLKDHIGLEGTVEDSQRFLDASYEATTWQFGGAGSAQKP
jgi:uncharacterized protein